MSDTVQHEPVMVEEVLEAMDFQPEQIVVDGTVGMAGHLQAILTAMDDRGQVFALDLDPEALAVASQRVGDAPVTFLNRSFAELPAIATQFAPSGFDRVLLDLGVSKDQLTSERFSFHGDGPLDFRLNADAGETAADLLARLSRDELAEMIRDLGDERFADRIARGIVEAREHQRIETADQLVPIIVKAYPRGARHGRIHVATRTFQALRMAVNGMIEALEIALEAVPPLLRPGGRFGIISFHSGEDRRVKHRFREWARDEAYELVTRRPRFASEAETAANPGARSARLRVLARKRGAS